MVSHVHISMVLLKFLYPVKKKLDLPDSMVAVIGIRQTYILGKKFNGGEGQKGVCQASCRIKGQKYRMLNYSHSIKLKLDFISFAVNSVVAYTGSLFHANTYSAAV